MCIAPKLAWRNREGEPLNFTLPVPEYAQKIYVNCGKCVECQDRYSKEWALRCSLEAKKYDYNCFITLTYAEAPDSVSKRDFQLFIKRLRKKIQPLKIKYFGCGEYGDLKGRPHYHINIFGWQPTDLYFWSKSKSNSEIFRSKTIEDLWSYGFSTVQKCDFNTVKYTALYMQKFLNYGDREKPFALMSQGLGADSIYEFDLVKDSTIYFNGYKYPVPRYFVKKLEEITDMTAFKDNRRKKAELCSFLVSSERLKARYNRQYKLLSQIKNKDLLPKKFYDKKFINELSEVKNLLSMKRFYLRQDFYKLLLTNGENCDIFGLDR